jgi:hypothetical protein
VRRGDTVTKLTKRVGQNAPVGRVVAVKGDSVEVTWEDGHTSLTSRVGLVVAKNR